jgi:hypothetical protein
MNTTMLRQLQADIEAARFARAPGRRSAGQAEGSRFGLRSAREVVHADGRQLSLHSHRLDPFDQKPCTTISNAHGRSTNGWRRFANRWAHRHKIACRSKICPCVEPRQSVLGCASGGGRRTRVERVDRLVQSVAAQRGMRSEVIDEIVAIVDTRLEANRRARR